MSTVIIQNLRIYTHRPTRLAKTRKSKQKRIIVNVGKAVEKLKPSYTAHENIKWGNHYGKHFMSKSYRMTLSHSTPRDIYPREKKTCPAKNTHKCSQQHYSKEPESENNPNVSQGVNR